MSVDDIAIWLNRSFYLSNSRSENRLRGFCDWHITPITEPLTVMPILWEINVETINNMSQKQINYTYYSNNKHKWKGVQ